MRARFGLGEAARSLGPLDRINERMRTHAPEILRTYGKLAENVVPGLGEAVQAGTLGLVSVSAVYEKLGALVLEVAKVSEPVADVLLLAIMEPSFLLPPFLPGPATMAQIVAQLYKAHLDRYLWAAAVNPVAGPIAVAVYDGLAGLWDAAFGKSEAELRQIAAQDEAFRRQTERIAEWGVILNKTARLVSDSTDPCITDQAAEWSRVMSASRTILAAASAAATLSLRVSFANQVSLAMRPVLARIEECGRLALAQDVRRRVAEAQVAEARARAQSAQEAAANPVAGTMRWTCALVRVNYRDGHWELQDAAGKVVERGPAGQAPGVRAAGYDDEGRMICESPPAEPPARPPRPQTPAGSSISVPGLVAGGVGLAALGWALTRGR